MNTEKKPCPHAARCLASGEDCFEGDYERAERHCYVGDKPLPEINEKAR